MVRSVAEFLRTHSLDTYIDAFAEHEYDHLPLILAMNEEAITKLVAEVKMKSGSALKLRQAIQNENSGGTAKKAVFSESAAGAGSAPAASPSKSSMAPLKPSMEAQKSVRFHEHSTDDGDYRMARVVDETTKIDGNRWNYSNELAEWKRYHRVYVERVILLHLRERLSRIREGCTVLLTLITCFTTLITSLAVGSEGMLRDSGSDAGVNGTNDAPGGMACEGVMSCMVVYQSYIFILLSFTTTVISGFVQLQSPFWKRVDKGGAALEQKCAGSQQQRTRAACLPFFSRTCTFARARTYPLPPSLTTPSCVRACMHACDACALHPLQIRRARGLLLRPARDAARGTRELRRVCEEAAHARDRDPEPAHPRGGGHAGGARAAQARGGARAPLRPFRVGARLLVAGAGAALAERARDRRGDAHRLFSGRLRAVRASRLAVDLHLHVQAMLCVPLCVCG